MSTHHIVHLKLIQCHISNYISIKLSWEKIKGALMVPTNSLYFVPSVRVPLCRPLALTLFCQLVNDLKERKKGDRHCSCICVSVCLVAQRCLTLCDPVDGSPPGSSVHVTLQAGVLEWVAIFYFRGSFRPRDRACVS